MLLAKYDSCILQLVVTSLECTLGSLEAGLICHAGHTLCCAFAALSAHARLSLGFMSLT